MQQLAPLRQARQWAKRTRARSCARKSGGIWIPAKVAAPGTKEEDGEGEGDDLRILTWTQPVGGRPDAGESGDADSETGAAPAAGRGRGRCICRRRVPAPPPFGGERVEEAEDASSVRMRSGLSLSERTRIVSAVWVR